MCGTNLRDSFLLVSLTQPLSLSSVRSKDRNLFSLYRLLLEILYKTMTMYYKMSSPPPWNDDDEGFFFVHAHAAKGEEEKELFPGFGYTMKVMWVMGPTITFRRRPIGGFCGVCRRHHSEVCLSDCTCTVRRTIAGGTQSPASRPRREFGILLVLNTFKPFEFQKRRTMPKIVGQFGDIQC